MRHRELDSCRLYERLPHAKLDPPMCHVIAIANQKGGVGKTTTAVNLGASLAAAERRTLVIDMDPQGNASSGLGDLGKVARSMKTSLYGALINGSPISEAIIHSVHLPLLDVVPTTTDLVGIDIELADLPEREFRLRRALEDVRNEYDFILIDCPPGIGLITLNALVAADKVIVPLQPEYFALEGIADFTETLNVVRARLNPRLRIEGVLFTLYDPRLKLTTQVEDEVRTYFASSLFRTVIPRNVRLAEAPSFGMPALVYAIESSGAQAYLALASELIARNTEGPSNRHVAAGVHR